MRGAVRWPAGLGLLAAAVYGWGMSRGAPHFYYSAAVRSMSASWSNLWFGALDPAGSITVDKSPGGLWLQALSVRVFGFHDVALLLSGTLAAAACVPLLYAAVRRWAGHRAGVVAALVLALTPATFAAARVNIPDPVLVLCLAAAAYALTRASADATARWVVLCGALLGAGFLTKMLQAWLVLPAFCAALLAVPGWSWRRRAASTGLMGAVCLAVSLSWTALVDAVPGTDRPYVDGSSGNSAWEMVFAYNGPVRGAAVTAMSVPFGGATGPARLLDVQLAGQIGWLLPAAILLGAAAGVLTWRRHPELRAGWVLWGGWLLVVATAFSALRGIHPYYAATLAPAIAALVGAGGDWCACHARRALVAATALTAVTCVVVLSRTPSTAPIVAFVLVGAAATAIVARGSDRALRMTALIAGLVGPAAWIAVTPPLAPHAFGTTNPVAGPQVPEVVYGSTVTTPLLSMITGAPPGAPTPPVDAPMAGSTPDANLVGFLLRHRQPGQRYLLAAGNAGMAAPYIAAGHSVLPMGGFTSAAPFPSASELEQLVRERDVRFVLDVPGPGRGAAGARTGWLARNCAPVDPSAYGGAMPSAVLHDCGLVAP